MLDGGRSYLVLADEVQIVATDDDGALHLVRAHDSLEDASADGHIAGEGALLVDVGALDGLLGRAVAETDGLVVAHHAVLLLRQQTGLGLGNSLLLLESALDLQHTATPQRQRHSDTHGRASTQQAAMATEADKWMRLERAAAAARCGAVPRMLAADPSLSPHLLSHVGYVWGSTKRTQKGN